LLNPVTSAGEAAADAAKDLYKSVANVSVRTLQAEDDPVQVLSTWR
jgi:hypothetical protein